MQGADAPDKYQKWVSCSSLPILSWCSLSLPCTLLDPQAHCLETIHQTPHYSKYDSMALLPISLHVPKNTATGCTSAHSLLHKSGVSLFHCIQLGPTKINDQIIPYIKTKQTKRETKTVKKRRHFILMEASANCS